jgi:hypothetical protein
MGIPQVNMQKIPLSTRTTSEEDVLDLRRSRMRVRRPNGHSAGRSADRSYASARALSVPDGRRNQRLLARLEAENAELRNEAVDLVLRIQELRDGDPAVA